MHIIRSVASVRLSAALRLWPAIALAAMTAGCDASVTLVANRPPSQPRVADVSLHVTAGARVGTITDVTGFCGAVENNGAVARNGQPVVSVPGLDSGSVFLVNVATVLSVPPGAGEDALFVIGIADKGPGTYRVDVDQVGVLLEVGGTTDPFRRSQSGEVAHPAWLGAGGSLTLETGEQSGTIDVTLRGFDPTSPAGQRGRVDGHITGTFRCVDLTQK